MRSGGEEIVPPSRSPPIIDQIAIVFIISHSFIVHTTYILTGLSLSTTSWTHRRSLYPFNGPFCPSSAITLISTYAYLDFPSPFPTPRPFFSQMTSPDILTPLSASDLPERRNDEERDGNRSSPAILTDQLPQEALATISAILLESERYYTLTSFRLTSKECSVASKLVAKRFFVTDATTSSLKKLANDPESKYIQ